MCWASWVARNSICTLCSCETCACDPRASGYRRHSPSVWAECCAIASRDYKISVFAAFAWTRAVRWRREREREEGARARPQDAKSTSATIQPRAQERPVPESGPSDPSSCKLKLKRPASLVFDHFNPEHRHYGHQVSKVIVHIGNRLISSSRGLSRAACSARSSRVCHNSVDYHWLLTRTHAGEIASSKLIETEKVFSLLVIGALSKLPFRSRALFPPHVCHRARHRSSTAASSARRSALAPPRTRISQLAAVLACLSFALARLAASFALVSFSCRPLPRLCPRPSACFPPLVHLVPRRAALAHSIR